MKKILLLFLFVLFTIIAWSQSTVRMATASGTYQYTATFNPPLTSLNSQTMYTVTFTNANTSTAVTLDPDGAITAIDIKQNDGAVIDVGAIVAGGTYNLKYDPSSGDFKIIGGTGSGGGGGSTNIYNSDGSLTGNRTLNGDGFTFTQSNILNYSLTATSFVDINSGTGGVDIDATGDIALTSSSGDINTIGEAISIQATTGNITQVSTLGSISLTSTIGDVTLQAGDNIDLNPANDILLKGVAAGSPTTQFFRGDGTWAVVGPGTPDLTWVTKTANYTPVASDSSLVQPAFNMRSASAISFTIPPFSTTNFAMGQTFLVYNDSTGALSILEGAGVNFETTAEGGTGPWTLDEDEYVVVTKSNSTNTWKLMMGSVSSATNIYNSDGTLLGDRTITGSGNDLILSGIGALNSTLTSLYWVASADMEFASTGGDIRFTVNNRNIEFDASGSNYITFDGDADDEVIMNAGEGGFQVNSGGTTFMLNRDADDDAEFSAIDDILLIAADDINISAADDLLLNGTIGTTNQVISNTNGHAAWTTITDDFWPLGGTGYATDDIIISDLTHSRALWIGDPFWYFDYTYFKANHFFFVSNDDLILQGVGRLSFNSDQGEIILRADDSISFVTPVVKIPNVPIADTTAYLMAWRNADSVMVRRNVSTISGSGGITNTAAANEIPKSDGTNIIPSGVFSNTSSNLTLGDGSSSGTTRVITAAGSDANVLLILGSKAEPVLIQNEFAVYDVQSGFVIGNEVGKSIYITADLTNHTIGGGDGDTGKDFDIKASNGIGSGDAGRTLNLYGGNAFGTGDLNGGSILLTSGTKNGSGVDGNITIDTLTGYLIISTIPTSSAGLPSGAVWANSNVLTIVP